MWTTVWITVKGAATVKTSKIFQIPSFKAAYDCPESTRTVSQCMMGLGSVTQHKDAGGWHAHHKCPCNFYFGGFLCFLTMFSCRRGSGTCGPPGRTCCCSVPCIRRARTRSRWPGRTRCCGRNLPAPQRLRWTRPATSSSLKRRERRRAVIYTALQIKVDHWKKTGFFFFLCFGKFYFFTLAAKERGAPLKKILQLSTRGKRRHLRRNQRILEFIEFKSSPFIRPMRCIQINSGA